MMVEFHHGALVDTYEEQANKQGFTFGDKAEWIEDIAFGLNCAYVLGCMTDSEHNKIIRRFQQKVLLKNLQRLKDGNKKGEDT